MFASGEALGQKKLDPCLRRHILGISSSFEAADCGLQARRRPTKSQTCSIGDTPDEAVQGRSHICWFEQKSRTVLAACGVALSC
ncbi:hypothetical protein TNCV_784711 [Trichonephila clavipes]|nr:hypothetical protein TNCV_784711 [Trichonephila clavipes]